MLELVSPVLYISDRCALVYVVAEVVGEVFCGASLQAAYERVTLSDTFGSSRFFSLKNLPNDVAGMLLVYLVC